jgi:hypothetical protein
MSIEVTDGQEARTDMRIEILELRMDIKRHNAYAMTKLNEAMELFTRADAKQRRADEIERMLSVAQESMR